MRTVDENAIRAALANVSNEETLAACEKMVEAVRRRERAMYAREAASYRFMEMSQGEDQ